MQVRELAEAIVCSEDIDFKLAALPEELDDSEPGPPCVSKSPDAPPG